MLSRRSLFATLAGAVAALRAPAVAADVATVASTEMQGVLIRVVRIMNPDGSVSFADTYQFGPPIELIAPMKTITIDWSEKDFEA